MTIDPRLRSAWERYLELLPLFAALAVIAVWSLASATLATLPGPVPLHYDLAGAPNGFGPWWALPAIATGLLLVMAGVHRLALGLARTRPAWLNLPAKATFVALPVAARLRVVARVGQLLYGFALLVALAVLALTRDTYRIATHELAELAVWKLAVLLGLLAVWSVVAVIRIRNLVRREGALVLAAR